MTRTFDHIDVNGLISQLADSVLQKHPDISNIVLVGLQTHGVPTAQRLKRELKKRTKVDVPVGSIETSLYRDDLIASQQFIALEASDIPFDITNTTLILVDVIMYHGRRTRAALHSLIDFGRPYEIELAVLIDRGHRKLPIQPTYTGIAIPTAADDELRITLLEIDGEDGIVFGSPDSD